VYIYIYIYIYIGFQVYIKPFLFQLTWLYTRLRVLWLSCMCYSSA